MAQEEKTTEQRISLQRVKAAYAGERRNARQLSKQARRVERLLIENAAVKNAAEELGKKKIENGFIPLGGGIYVQGKIESETFYQSGAGNVMIPVKKAGLLEEVKRRNDILEKEFQQLANTLKETNTSLMNLQRMLEMARAHQQKKKRK